MIKNKLYIDSIPAIIWGQPSDKVYIFVHGRYSCKEEAENFAGIAEGKGYQVISFDLPEHGERKMEDYKCTVQNGMNDLKKIIDYVELNWKKKSLFCVSFGAYFSLMTYKNMDFEKCLFVSPILNMEKLIRNMMKWINVSEDELKDKQEIPTPFGETLSWLYFSFVKDNPVEKWENKTYILYGGKDNLTEREVADDFVKKYNCDLLVMDDAEHYFRDKKHLDIYYKWIRENI